MRALLLLVALAGCRQVFGIDDIADIDAATDATPPPPDSDDSMGHAMITQAVAVPASPDGASTIVKTPIRGSLFDVTVDGSLVAQDADGGYTFAHTPGTLYRLDVAMATTHAVALSIQTSRSRVAYAFAQIGRPAGAEEQPTRELHYKGLGYVTSAPDDQLWTSGAWASYPTLSTGDGEVRFDMRAGAGLYGPTAPYDPAQNDRTYLLHFEDHAEQHLRLVTRARVDAPSFASTDIKQLDGPAPAVQPAQCAHLVSHHPAEVARIEDALGVDVTGTLWFASAVPAADLVYSGILVAQSLGTPDVDATTNFANPFGGTTTVVAFEDVAVRTLSTDGTNRAAIGVGTVAWTRVGTDCNQRVEQAAAAIGVAGQFRLDGAVLPAAATIDPDIEHVLSWSLAAAGPVDVYRVAAYELLSDGSLKPAPTLLLTTETRAVLPAHMLEKNRPYVFAVISSTGLAGIADGDLSTLGSTYGYGANATDPVRTVSDP